MMNDSNGAKQPLTMNSVQLEVGAMRDIERQVSGASTPMQLARREAAGINQGQVDELSMEWKDLTFSIDGKSILKAITGIVEPGRLTAVFGPSGSGKTTLLNVLAGRQRTTAKGMSFAGQISVAGRIIDPSEFRTNIAYVMQEDTMTPTATPRECLKFSAYLRLSRDISQQQRDEFVERLLTTLLLEKCANTLVGSALVKGISGGEKKRTAVGVELISNPKMLFLDEPLSGLDSYAAYTLMEVLKQLAEAGVPVLCTVHQPSSEIFAMFDDVIILHEGQVAFHGPSKKLALHFDSLGYPCPQNFNPADHVMFTLQKEPLESIRAIKERWNSSELMQVLNRKVDSLKQSGTEGTGNPLLEGAAGKPGFIMQLSVLTAREVKSFTRNKGLIGARFGMSIFLGLLYAWLFAGSAFASGDEDSKERNCLTTNFDAGSCTGDFQAHFGILVSLGIMAMMGSSQPIILEFPVQRPVFLREYAAGQYGVAAYFIAKTLVELPVVLMQQLVTLLVLYWPTGLYAHKQFVMLVLCTWLLGIASSSLALLVGCGVASATKAIQLAPLCFIPQMLFSGLFIPVNKIPLSLRWVQHLCPLKYSIDLLALSEFSDVKREVDDCEAELGKTACRITMPGNYLQLSLLKNQSVDFDNWLQYFIVLICLLVGFRIIAMFMLWRKGKYVF